MHEPYGFLQQQVGRGDVANGGVLGEARDAGELNGFHLRGAEHDGGRGIGRDAGLQRLHQADDGDVGQPEVKDDGVEVVFFDHVEERGSAVVFDQLDVGASNGGGSAVAESRVGADDHQL